MSTETDYSDAAAKRQLHLLNIEPHGDEQTAIRDQLRALRPDCSPDMQARIGRFLV